MEGRGRTYAIGLTVDAHDEGFEGSGGHAEGELGAAVLASILSAQPQAGVETREATTTYVSACNTTIPLTNSVGSFLVSMSTTRMRDVTENKPPCLYMRSLPVQHAGQLKVYSSAECELREERLPDISGHFEPDRLHPHAYFLCETLLLLWCSIHDEYEMVGCIVYPQLQRAHKRERG